MTSLKFLSMQSPSRWRDTRPSAIHSPPSTGLTGRQPWFEPSYQAKDGDIAGLASSFSVMGGEKRPWKSATKIIFLCWPLRFLIKTENCTAKPKLVSAGLPRIIFVKTLPLPNKHYGFIWRTKIGSKEAYTFISRSASSFPRCWYITVQDPAKATTQNSDCP